MKDSTQFSTPILFIIFNRVETAVEVFAQIKRIRPSVLYIAADGPRDHIQGDASACEKVRKEILGQIDWECNIHTLFRENNLGCKQSVREAITWMFETEDSGIILEDDCIPDVTFFEYCQKALQRYKDSPTVMMVSGTSYLASKTRDTDGVYFSRYFAIWGWATWKRAWNLYDKDMITWPKYKQSRKLYKTYPYIGVAPILSYQFDLAAQGKINTWDYQWFYTCASHEGMTVVPTKNLISNIGLMGAHAKGNYSRFRFMKTEALDVNNVVFPEIPSVDKNREFEVLKEIEIVSPYFWLTLLIKKLRSIKKSLFKKR